MGNKIIIDLEFKSYIDPITADEYAALEQSIQDDGCRHALVLWKGILIDGHNRYEICKKHGIAFKTTEFNRLDTRDDVFLWMIKNQLARRNVSDFTRVNLAVKQKDLVAAKAKAKQTSGKNQHSSLPQNSAEPSIETRNEIAKIAGVSHDTVSKVVRMQITAVPEVMDAARAGTISINAADAVATLPAEEQQAAAAEGKAGMQRAAKKVRDAKTSTKSKKEGIAQPERGTDEALRSENMELTADNARLRKEIDELNGIVATLKERNEALEKAADPNAATQLADLQQMLADVGNENQKLMEENVQLNNELARLQCAPPNQYPDLLQHGDDDFIDDLETEL